ncbi:LysM peptidoglycan-binding domain-containing protein [Amycolatopsis sp. cmx-4-83]|uniref:LysM peptidoglycan-binding domain-containing protein n=1 Tax=Amycolatopsis sp. cmx-4-83 TaxID=2790940 RepID=UPI003979744A
MRIPGVRTALCGVVLSSIVGGPPLALWRFRSVYLPDHVPDVTEVVSWSTSRDNGTLFLLLLVVAGVVAWLQLLVAIAVEVIARLRGAAAPRLAGCGWAQRVAAALLLVLLTGTAAEAAEQPAPDAGSTSHVVVPGESLAKIAAGSLGSAARYPEIFDLNRGVPQADGRSLQNPGLVRPGWVLQLPHFEGRDCEEVIVRPGETLSKIARDNLGDAARYREIFDLNRGRPQRSGRPIDDVDDIHPGDVLRIPASVKPSAGGGGSPVGGPAVVAEPCAAPAPPPVLAQPPAPPVHERPTPPPAAPAAEDGDSSALSLVVGGVLAAGLLSLLAVRRRRARQRRRPGHRVRLPQRGDFEAGLETVEQPATVETLDQALRTLARSAGGRLPLVQAIKVGPSGVKLLLTEPAEPLSPFESDSATEWKLDPVVVLDSEAPAPYPALASLGRTAGRDLVLVDLAQIGVVVLDGNRDAVEEVVLALAWELAVAPWAETTTVTVVGTGQSSAERQPDRVRFALSWEEAVLETREPGEVHVVLAADPLETRHLQQLESVAAVVAPCGEGLILPSAWHLDVGSARSFVEPLGEDIQLQRLSAEQADELVSALTSADEAIQVPAEEYRNVPPEDTGVPARLKREPDQPDQDRPAQPFLRLLGPVLLEGVDPQAVEGKKLNRLTELAAYLALHPGVTADEISRQLGSDSRPWSAATRQGYISRLRTWLGRDADGGLYVPNVDARQGGYRVSESFVSDWANFRQLARRGLARSDVSIPDLQEALDFVHGTPFSNVPAGRYAWSSWLQREMVDAIVDVAHTLADSYQKTGELPAARRAVRRGLQAEPVSEILYRDLLRIEFRAGNLAGVRETADKLTAMAASLAMELDEETSALVGTLLGRSSAGTC